MSRTSRRGPWLPEEDATLIHLVRTQGPNNWVRISQHMQHRSPKQCRERYHQNLKPSLNHEPITAQEGEMIEQLVLEMGKRWAEIARRLGNRSDNAVKNWWNGSMNRRKRSTVQHDGASKAVGYRTQPIPANGHPPRPYVYEQSPRSRNSYGHSYPFPPLFQRNESTNSLPMLTESPVRSEVSEGPHYLTRPHSHNTFHAKSSSFPPMEHRQPPSRDFESSHHRHHLPSPLVRDALPPLQRLDGGCFQLPPIQALERPIPSPTATEASHVSSNQQAPSLISDDQSNCSISPKTVPSPRPGLHAVQGTSTQLWGDVLRKPSLETNFLDSRSHLSRPLPDAERTEAPATHDRGEGAVNNKDSRMTLSRLLG